MKITRTMTVEDIMTPHVLTIEREATIAEAIALMQYHHVRTLIIEPQDTTENYGILTERDVVYGVIARRLQPEEVTVSDVMRSPCVMVFADSSIEEAAQRLAAADIQRAPIIDFNDEQDGKLVGIISITDIVMKMNWVGGEDQPLSHNLQKSLRHSRIISNTEQQISQETAIAWDVVEHYG